MAAGAILAFCLLIFIIVWMSLTFTNQFCTGKVGFGLCYKTACPVCMTSPAPSPSPAPASNTATTTSMYMSQPYSM